MLYFIRHLKTNVNNENIISGQIDFDILPDQQIIYNKELKGEEFIVYSSPSKRCIDTVKKLDEIVTIKDFSIDERLLERNLGILEGISKIDAQNKYPDLFYKGRIRVDANIQNAENVEDVVLRISNFLKSIVEISKNKNILICSHNQTLKIMYALINNIRITNEYWISFDFENGKIIKIL